jgi:hypothetical protein
MMQPSPDTTHHKEHIMENTLRIVQRDTGAWRAQVWISFGIALLVCGTGLAWLPGGDLDRAFMVMGYFFCLSSAFVLSKYVRDNAIAAFRHADVVRWWSGAASPCRWRSPAGACGAWRSTRPGRPTCW